MDYYSRGITLNTDNTPLFACGLDTKNERDTIAALEAAWKCQIKPFGKLCPVDFFALRDNRVVGVLELKSRTHPLKKYPTVFLNVRKWLALKMASYGMGCPAIFVVKFLDGIFFIPVDEIPVGQVSIGGTKQRVKSHTDIEPVFEVSVNLLKELTR